MNPGGPKPPSIWTPAREAELRRLVAEGLGAPAIARRLGASRSAVRGKCLRLGLKRVKRGYFRWTPAIVAQVREWAASGVTMEDTARRLGISASAVHSRAVVRGIRFDERAYLPADDARLRVLARTGLKTRALAAELGRSQASIRWRLRKLGLGRRSRIPKPKVLLATVRADAAAMVAPDRARLMAGKAA
ncbi:hypothetical protein FRZ44_38210 [Hypericibacter terrae]|uniref:Uncharacterized protein n=1 Tax=Hypericibacter terrae TaxID=2602015 RepID=A0A5J6MM36_9PROT|nr:GcrA family cell cycle regulator [Hypericibacter terrae]QEX18514.1 hypothetical protein FRZ44_38210 [Hypericibacter terrae]